HSGSTACTSPGGSSSRGSDAPFWLCSAKTGAQSRAIPTRTPPRREEVSFGWSDSPMAQTPPGHLPSIPGVTSPGTLIEDPKVEVNNLNNLNNQDRKHTVGDDAQFETDI
uniref:Uncharacterized protein n=1 Tax=Spermophilus dauricus TaxID=99837 RepID=A0A8C9Q0P4_SPEDA